MQILLPVYDSSGKTFDRSLYRHVRQELLGKFGGLTTYSRAPAKGLWAEGDHEVVKDDIEVYEVMVPELDRRWWADYRTALESRFMQQELVVRALAAELL